MNALPNALKEGNQMVCFPAKTVGPMDACVIGVFALWSLVSLARQISNASFTHKLQRIDFFGIFPKWRLFASDSAAPDLHLLYRDISTDQTATEWKEIKIAEERSLLFWDRGRLAYRGLDSLAQAVLRELQKDGGYSLVIRHDAFRIIAGFIVNQLHEPTATSTQFALVYSLYRYDRPQTAGVKFVSAEIPLKKRM